jgi:hypothetical protein
MRKRLAHNLTLEPENVKKIKKILDDQGTTLSAYVDEVIEDALRRYKKNRLPLAPASINLRNFQKTINKAVKYMEKYA